MIADFSFYQNEYKGYIIKSVDEYGYFAERASDELSRFVKLVPSTDEAQAQLKKCACAISDYLYNGVKTSKNGQKIASESVNGYYSVSYSVKSENEEKKAISSLIKKYIGEYVSYRPLRIYY